MSDPSPAVEPVVMPVADDEVGSMDAWMRSVRRVGPPRVLSHPTYIMLDEARAEVW